MSKSDLLESLEQALMLAQFRVNLISDRMNLDYQTYGHFLGATPSNQVAAEGFELGLLHAIAVIKHCCEQDGSYAPLTMLPASTIDNRLKCKGT